MIDLEDLRRRLAHLPARLTWNLGVRLSLDFSRAARPRRRLAGTDLGEPEDLLAEWSNLKVLGELCLDGGGSPFVVLSADGRVLSLDPELEENPLVFLNSDPERLVETVLALERVFETPGPLADQVVAAQRALLTIEPERAQESDWNALLKYASEHARLTRP